MLWLFATGPEGQVCRWPLGPGTHLVGRASALEVPWDRALSRLHFVVRAEGGGLRVLRRPEASNPLFYQGQAAETFVLASGEHFVAGNTRFQLVERALTEAPPPAREFTLAAEARNRLRDERARECLSTLTRLLPRLQAAVEVEDLWEAGLEILRGLLPAPTRAFVVALEEEPRLVRGVSEADFFSPSRRLLGLAFEQGQTAVHLWNRSAGPEMTVAPGATWALAAPLSVGGDDERYALYAVGEGTEGPGEQERVLIDLVAEALGHFLESRRANRLAAQVGQFFSPSLRHLMVGRELAEVLTPSLRTVTVMFFDLRGFSRATEKADALSSVLEHHSTLTDVMSEVTRCVFDQEGIVLDYAGDAVMASWGAPLEQPDHAARAVRAAGRVVARVHGMDLPFLHQTGRGRVMRCGVGMATGQVVAGQVGARDQVKYGFIGAVVNQAARLEGLTKYLGVPLIVTAELRAALDPEEFLCRRIGRVRPAGMGEAVELHEVVLPEEDGGSGLTAGQVAAYEAGEAAFCAGEMLECLRLLREVPVEDPVARFLSRRAYACEDEGLPSDWDGVIEFRTK